MSAHWKSVLPVDRYIVRLNGLLHDHDRKIITRLYQPLIGAAAYSLYMTFWGETNEDRLWGEPATHHSLMTTTQMNLKTIYEQRKKLEGLGLLKTFLKEGEEFRTYLYELEPPLDPDSFFNDEVLPVYLYNRVGKAKFTTLKKAFSVKSIDFSQFRQETASFNEVFSSVQQSELKAKKETSEAIHSEEESEWMQRHSPDGLPFSSKPFDFDLMMRHLSGLIIPKEAITDQVRDAVLKLAFVYNIGPVEMCKRLERAYVDRGGHLELDALRKEVGDWYAFENGNRLPSLSFRIQPLKYQTAAGCEPQTEEEKIIRAFETYSPAELLEQIAGGAKPALSDLRAIEGIMFDQKLAPGVVNVLIDYVTSTNDMKLNRSYIEKIASHWARKKVKTVAEAMSLARSEHQKYQNWANPKKAKSNAGKGKSRTPKRREPLPKWMTDEKKSEQDPEWENLRKQLERKLKDS